MAHTQGNKQSIETVSGETQMCQLEKTLNGLLQTFSKEIMSK